MKVKILFPLLSFCLMLLTSVASSAQTATIKGMISLSTNEAADNVSVTLKGTRVGTTTDAQGNYEIKNVKPGTYTIRVSAVGFSSKEKSITVSSANEIIENFTLITTSENLTEVFVKGNANKYTKSESEYVSRMQVKNLENSQVYNVVTKELMKDQLVTNQDEALKNVPGLYQLWGATNRAGDGGSWYSLRGFTTQSLVRNGIAGKVNSNSDAANLERIEVIKGPSATLFGNVLSSYGGLINRVTKKPYETFGGEIAYQAGSYGFNRVSADINTPLNDDNTALFRLNTSYNNTNTFQDYGSSRSFFVAPSFSYKVNDKLTLSLDAEIGDQNNSGMPLIYLPFGVSIADIGFNNAKDLKMDFKRSFWGDEFITNTKTFNVFAQANYKISDEWTSQSVFSSTSNRASGPQTWFYLLPNESLSRNAWNANGKDNAIEFQQNFNGDFLLFGSMRNRFLVGGDLFHSTSRLGYRLLPGEDFDKISYTGAAPTYNNFNPTAVNAQFVNGSDYKTNSALSTYSAYVADAINITESLIVSAAVRFDHYENQGTTDDTTGQKAGDFSQNAFSPKFGVVYQVIKDQVSVFGNYQNSFTNVGYANANVGGNLQLQKFDPERANQFEGGIKVNAFQNKVSATLSYYDIKVKDIVTADPSLPNASVQNGTQYSKGFELEVTANPIPGLNLLVGYSNNDSKLNGLRPVTAGPENLINYWISYNLQNAAFKGLGLGFGGNYGDATYIYNSGTETFELPSYAVINAALYYDQPKYRVSLKVNNLTDELYFNGYTTINVQAPRTFMGSVTYKF